MTRESSSVISERYASHPNLMAYHLIILQDNVNITDQGQAQISDFGIARILDVESFMKMTQSNIRYTAPELVPAELNVDLVDVRPTFRSDIFSLGMLLLQVRGRWACVLSVKNSQTIFLKLFNGSDGKSLKGLPYNHIRASSELGMVKRIHDGVRPQRERYNRIDDKYWNLICCAGLAILPNAQPSEKSDRHYCKVC